MDGDGRTSRHPTFEETDDPIALSLRAHAAHRDDGGVVLPICPDVGRRLLLAETSSSDWVLRRVERVHFQDDRHVVREVTIELRVPDDAPEFGDGSASGDGRYWLVPLASMWRRTLVNFTMTDEDGKAMTLPGLRLTQQLDQSILLAAAAAAGTTVRDPHLDEGVRTFVRRIVTGARPEVESTWDAFDRRRGGSVALQALRDVPAFRLTAERLRGGFSLFAFLRCTEGRRRLLQLSFVEPLTWAYQQPTIERVDEERRQGWAYDAGLPRRHPSWYLAALGLTATRLRLQVPAAEHAASYHLEVMAPPGVRIGEATLIAGRPGASRDSFTVDHVRGSAQTVGLHGINVPSGSSCRAQIHMHVQSAGWLSVTTVATVGVLIGLVAAFRHTGARGSQVDNLVVLLLTGAAAAATFIAHREHGTVAARLVTLVRVSATVSASLLVAAAVLIAFLGDLPVPEPRTLNTPQAEDVTPEDTVHDVLIWLIGLAGLLALHLFVVRRMSLRIERRQGDLSPWDMVPGPRPRPPGRLHAWWRRRLQARHEAACTRRFYRLVPEPDTPRDDVLRLFVEHGFDRPAIGIRSGEAWHRRFDDDDPAAIAAMTRALQTGGERCGPDGFTCPRSRRGTCRLGVASQPAADGGPPADSTPSAEGARPAEGAAPADEGAPAGRPAPMDRAPR